MSVIGDRMRELRGPSSLREMADAIGIKFNAWARYESGTVLPGAEIITKICRIHACSADWLLGIDRPSSPSINVRGSGNAINSPNAKVSVVSSAQSNCKTCPYKAAVKRLQKAGIIVEGV